MAKISAEQVSLQGDKYLGTSYKTMDCQAFVERCLADAGLKINLAGSNTWYRECRQNGWVGSPEQCRREFGKIPRGAFLFILEQDGGEVKRGYRDGLGNASHIGLYTGRGKGAIHSSSTRKCVAESAFSGRTIPNGGWNTVGLWKRLSYGADIDNKLHGGGDMGILEDLTKLFGGQTPQPATTQTDLQPTTMTDLGTGPSVPAGTSPQQAGEIGAEIGATRIVTAASGNTVRVREAPGGAKIAELPLGTRVTALGGKTDRHGVEWTKIRYEAEGWMMSKFLRGDV